ncbi:MAG: hypothetical protein HKO59_06065 [Phycisphaerales bacterium]|nr:hypothetical protein [Phycisphaerae bacterium]NNF43367.1 hypothetical protein [Phycisphaerales bacterium]NNM25538.1 hypothetical protein [Phycisphaerales bacterium]
MSAKMFTGVAAAAIALTVGSSAFAGLTTPSFLMTWDASLDASDPFAYDPGDFGDVIDQGLGTFQYLGSLSGSTYDVDWDVSVNDDTFGGLTGGDGPFINAAITVTNNSDEFQSFSLLMTLGGVSPIGPSSLMAGSVGATVTNNQVDGDATLRAGAGGSVYSGLIDLASVATLWDDPYSLVATGPFATASDDTSFGDPVKVPGPAVTDSISILLEFELSPRDSASVSGTFSVVPGPGALSLLAVFGLAGRRRRRA